MAKASAPQRQRQRRHSGFPDVIPLLLLSCGAVVDGVVHIDGSMPSRLPGRVGPSVDGAAAATDDAISYVLCTVRSWQARRWEREPEEQSKEQRPRRWRPFVTMTYAQSLDGFIAVIEEDDSESDAEDYETSSSSGGSAGRGRPRRRKTSSNLRLSGSDSTRLTHGLRSMHDAVLVGSGTLAADNPRLNVRMWPPSSPLRRQPRPVVLDTELGGVRSILAGSGALRARGLIVCCSRSAAERHGDEVLLAAAKSSDVANGAAATEPPPPPLTLLPCDLDTSGTGLDLYDVLCRLRSQHGIRSVMVEGGAGVLSSFATSSSSLSADADADLLDCLVVTISPNVIGGMRGVGAFRTLDCASGAKTGTLRREDHDGPMIRLGGPSSESRFVTGIGSDCVFLAPWRSQ